MLAEIDLIRLTGDVFDDSADLGQARFLSLDAIHLAGALLICEEVAGFIAYHLRLSSATFATALESVRPGA